MFRKNKPQAPPFSMQVPLDLDHWIAISSNRPMTSAAWARLIRFLDLQHEIWGEDTQAIEAQRAETAETGSVYESAGGNADAPNPQSSTTQHGDKG